ncbi:unnamed protein product [Lactuca saligna]|uniref:Uncharacterized protein n=1 Tax=Lactuca saligna TaxID=75948 RepID=A0AA35ZNC9_LACSI|nr:unnamed protein product [Lactuca saligna]
MWNPLRWIHGYRRLRKASSFQADHTVSFWTLLRNPNLNSSTIYNVHSYKACLQSPPTNPNVKVMKKVKPHNHFQYVTRFVIRSINLHRNRKKWVTKK